LPDVSYLFNRGLLVYSYIIHARVVNPTSLSTRFLLCRNQESFGFKNMCTHELLERVTHIIHILNCVGFVASVRALGLGEWQNLSGYKQLRHEIPIWSLFNYSFGHMTSQ